MNSSSISVHHHLYTYSSSKCLWQRFSPVSYHIVCSSWQNTWEQIFLNSWFIEEIPLRMCLDNLHSLLPGEILIFNSSCWPEIQSSEQNSGKQGGIKHESIVGLNINHYRYKKNIKNKNHCPTQWQKDLNDLMQLFPKKLVRYENQQSVIPILNYFNFHSH